MIQRVLRRAAALAGFSLLVPLGVPFSAFAATATNFSAQYQSNATQEASLLQTAQADTGSSSATEMLSASVQTLEDDIATLYAVEQSLAAFSQTGAGIVSSYAQLQGQLRQLDQRSQSLIQAYKRNSQSHSQQTRHATRTEYSQWKALQARIGALKQQMRAFSDTSSGGVTGYRQGLRSLQSAILSLQVTAMADTRQWIASAGHTSGVPSGTSLVATPSVALGSDGNGNPEIVASGAQAGATLDLYTASGTLTASAVADASGSAVFDDPAAGTYYVKEQFNGATSADSSPISVSAASATRLATIPSVALGTDGNGMPEIAVSGAQAGATLDLYTGNGTLKASAVANASGNAVFDDPAAGTYYVVENYDGVQSADSSLLSVAAATVTRLAVPNVALGTDGNGNPEIVVSGAQAGAMLDLYMVNGPLETSAVADLSGNAVFDDPAAGTYYVVENYDGVQSADSSPISVSTPSVTSLAAPSVTLGTDATGRPEIVASGVQAGATLYLYMDNGTLVESAVAEASGSAVFDDPTPGTYYVAASYDGMQSADSAPISVMTSSVTTLAAPGVTLGTDGTGKPEIAVSGAQAGETLDLYTSSGILTASAVADASGNAVFDDPSPGMYFVVGSENGETSAASASVTVS